jgi:hypothetical protein
MKSNKEVPPVKKQPIVESSEEDETIMDNYDPFDELAKLEKKKNRISGPTKSQRIKQHKDNRKDKVTRKMDTRKAQKMSHITTLDFKEEVDSSLKKKKAKKTVEEDASEDVMSLESASSFVSQSLPEIFERAKAIYDKDVLQLREVIDSIQSIYSLISWKHTFDVNEPKNLAILDNETVKSLVKFISVRDSTSVIENILWLVKTIYDESGAESHPHKNVGYKVMLQFLGQNRPLQLCTCSELIFKRFLKTGKPLENFYWVIGQAGVTDVSQVVNIWSKTLGKAFKVVAKDRSLEFLKNSLEKTTKFDFDEETFCWIQKRAFIDKELVDLYESIKKGIDFTDLKYFEEMAKHLDKHPSQTEYITEVTSCMRPVLSTKSGQDFYATHIEKYFASFYILLGTVSHIADIPDLAIIEKFKKSNPKKYTQVEKLAADLSVKSGPNIGFLFMVITVVMMILAFCALKYTAIGQELLEKIRK